MKLIWRGLHGNFEKVKTLLKTQIYVENSCFNTENRPFHCNNSLSPFRNPVRKTLGNFDVFSCVIPRDVARNIF